MGSQPQLSILVPTTDINLSIFCAENMNTGGQLLQNIID